jgi:acetyl-CoA C-acetyltransferase
MYVYLARVAALDAGVAQEAPALTLNRLCGSGLQAIVSAAKSILLGHADIAVGAGAESMSCAAYLAQGVRWGARMGDAAADHRRLRRQQWRAGASMEARTASPGR